MFSDLVAAKAVPILFATIEKPTRAKNAVQYDQKERFRKWARETGGRYVVYGSGVRARFPIDIGKLQVALGAPYRLAGGLGDPFDHRFCAYDTFYQQKVFIVEPNVTVWHRPEAQAEAETTNAMELTARELGLDITPLDYFFHSDLTLAFAIRVPFQSIDVWQRSLRPTND